MKKRAQRRHHMFRMKSRAKWWLRYILKYKEEEINLKSIGRAATDHCTHQCKLCKWEKHFPKGLNARPFSEYRKGIMNDSQP